VKHAELGEARFDAFAALDVCRAFFFKIATQVDVGVELFDFAPDLIGDFDGAQLHERGPADGLLHAQLARAPCGVQD